MRTEEEEGREDVEGEERRYTRRGSHPIKARAVLLGDRLVDSDAAVCLRDRLLTPQPDALGRPESSEKANHGPLNGITACETARAPVRPASTATKSTSHWPRHGCWRLRGWSRCIAAGMCRQPLQTPGSSAKQRRPRPRLGVPSGQQQRSSVGIDSRRGQRHLRRHSVESRGTLESSYSSIRDRVIVLRLREPN